jgi:hypothetical protein
MVSSLVDMELANSTSKEDALQDLNAILSGHPGVLATGADQASRRIYVYVSRKRRQEVESILPAMIHNWRVIVRSSGRFTPAD